MVDQQKFHHAFARFFHHGRVGLDARCLSFGTWAQITDLHRAGCGRFGRTADDLDKTHAAVARDGQALVIAETRDFDPRLFTGLNQGQCPIHFDFGIVDYDLA